VKDIKVGKITVNMGVGESGEELKKAIKILKKITGKKPIQTLCKVKAPTLNIRPGLPIGAKVTLRGTDAVEFLKQAFLAKENMLAGKNFDRNGNFGFGIKEYIDLPNIKYEPELGIKGFDVLVSLERAGYRIKKRKIGKKKVGRKHCVSREEAIEFITEKFGVEIA